MAAPGDLVRRAGRPRLRRKTGAIERLYTAPPEGSAILCLDEMGPQSAKSHPGQRLVRVEPRPGDDGATRPAERARQEVDYGRRGKGYIFGAFRPATGEVLTAPYASRGVADWVDEVCRAVEEATVYWNKHRHRFVWGRRRRYRLRRKPGIAAVPGIRRLAG